MPEHRRQHLAAVRSLVIKLGTQLLTDRQGQLDHAYLQTIAAQVIALKPRNNQDTMVSAGAIGAGLLARHA